MRPVFLRYFVLGVVGAGLLHFSVLAAPLTIQADSFELDSKKNILLTSGNVVAIQADVRLTGPFGLYEQAKQKISFTRGVDVQRGAIRLSADQAVADGVLQRISLSGNVQFYYQDIRGTAEFGVYDLVAKTVLFTGNPNVWQGEDHVTGDTIFFDSNTGKLRTSGRARVRLSADKFNKQ